MGKYVPLPQIPGGIVESHIDSKFGQANEIINSARTELFEFIQNLTDVVNTELQQIEDIETTFDGVYQRLEMLIPERPESPTISFDEIPLPTAPTLTQPTIDALDEIPAFDVAAVNINLPDTPDSTLPAEPTGAPSINEIDIPAKPDITLPSVPTLTDYTIPSPPEINIPIFEGEMPVWDVEIPTSMFQWSENLYTSQLLDILKDKMSTDLTEGGTGLSPEVEQAIWDREKERAEYALQESMNNLANEWAASGFPLPDGVLTAGQLDLQKQYQDSRLTTSREIAIKQAELEQQNIHHSLQQGVVLEGEVMTYYSQAAQRSLDAAKVVSEIGIRIFEAQVKRYEAQLEGYKAIAAVYQARIQGALATVEVYKAQIEGVKAAIQTDAAKVELYKAQIAGAEALMGMYKTEMEAASVRANIEKLRLDLFRAQIEIFQMQVQAKVAEYQMYESSIKGQMALVEIYKAQVEAYKTRVEAAKARSDVILAEIKAQIEINNSQTEIYSENIKAYATQMEAAKTKAMTYIEAYKGEVSMFEAEARAEAELIDASVKKYAGDIEAYKAQVSALIENGKLKIEQIAETLRVKLEAARTVAQVLAQIVASALSSVNASVSEQMQQSLSASLNEQHSLSASNVAQNSTLVTRNLDDTEGMPGPTSAEDY